MTSNSQRVRYVWRPKHKMTWWEAIRSFYSNIEEEKSKFIKVMTTIVAWVHRIGITASAVTFFDNLVGMLMNEYVWICFGLYSAISIIVIRHRANRPIVEYR